MGWTAIIGWCAQQTFFILSLTYRNGVPLLNNWRPQQAWVMPERGIIQVWRLFPSKWEHYLQDFWLMLNNEEHERAQRYRFERDRMRYLVSKASLRSLLAKAMGCSPKEIKFGKNDYGKPLLESRHCDLTFNTSHSGDLVVHAIASRQQVGIDVEEISDTRDLRGIASFFSPKEIAELLSDKDHHHTANFFALWTRKEAYIKGLGLGLSKPLNSFAMVVDANQKPELYFDLEDPQATQNWEFLQIDADPGYAGTVAVQGKVKELHCWDFTQIRRATSGLRN